MTNRDTLREIETELETLFDNVLGSEDRYRALIDVTRLARPNEYNHDEPEVAYVQVAVRVPAALEGNSDVLGRIAEAAQDYVNETYDRPESE